MKLSPTVNYFNAGSAKMATINLEENREYGSFLDLVKSSSKSMDRNFAPE